VDSGITDIGGGEEVMGRKQPNPMPKGIKRPSPPLAPPPVESCPRCSLSAENIREEFRLASDRLEKLERVAEAARNYRKNMTIGWGLEVDKALRSLEE